MYTVGSDDDYGAELDYNSALEEALRTAEAGRHAGVTDIEDAVALSPFDEFRRRNWLSVSDLVGTVWCEVQFDYRIRTQPWLKPEDRPTQIKSTKGALVPVNKVKVEDKEKILRRGETIHKRLEREIHPVEIQVQWVTEEDKWGLRILNMLAAMEALLTLNKCRELPVVGFVGDVLVFGIIDELTREPVEKVGSKRDTRSTRSSTNRQATLNDFFGGTRPRTHRVFVSDSKTRTGGSLPKEEDTKAGRLQCMLYKELLDALLVTGGPPVDGKATSSQAQGDAATCHSSSTATANSASSAVDAGVTVLEDAQVSSILDAQGSTQTEPQPATAQPVHQDALSILPSHSPLGSVWWRVISHFQLDPNAPFTDKFVNGARPVVVGNDLRFGADTGRTLADYIEVWESYVAALGLGTHSDHSPLDGVTENKLELVYRRASGKRKDKQSSRKRRKGKKGKGKKRSAGDGDGDGSAGAPDVNATVEMTEDGDLKRAIALSLQEPQSSSLVQEPVSSAADDEAAELDLAIRLSLQGAPSDSNPLESPSHGDGTQTEAPSSALLGDTQSATVTMATPPGDVEMGEERMPVPTTPPARHNIIDPDYSPASFVTADEFDSPMASRTDAAADPQTALRPISRQSKYFDSDSELERELVELAWAAEMSLPQPEPPTTQARVLHAEVAAPAPRRSRSPSPSPVSGSIIGRHTFQHDQGMLASHLSSVLAYWMGEREPLGVEAHDTKKCGWCEFEEGCEWREMKAREAFMAYLSRTG